MSVRIAVTIQECALTTTFNNSSMTSFESAHWLNDKRSILGLIFTAYSSVGLSSRSMAGKHNNV